jgi:hypothetical protein
MKLDTGVERSIMGKKSVIIILLFSLLLSSCELFDLFPSMSLGWNSGKLNSPPSSNTNPENGNSESGNGNSADTVGNPAQQLPSATNTLTPTVTPTSTPTNTPTPASQSFGPDEYPEGVNPLTCLPVLNPASLVYPPALISVTNFPASARPQSGLAWANWVIEGYIGEGMNRFLAIFHGNYPSSNSGGSFTLPDSTTTIGPIRSGRVWYEDWRQLFNGFLVAASGAPQVVAQLGAFTSFFGSDESDINSALIPINILQQIAESNTNRLGDSALDGNLCDIKAPEGGELASSLLVYYAPLNQAIWKYDSSLGAYQRYWNDTVTGENFTLMKDRIEDIPLKFENVIIVYSNFHGSKDTYFYIDLLYSNGPAQILRDSKIYNIRWTTEAGEYEKTTGKNRPMRFTYENGEPFPLKPGQTWILLAPLGSMRTMHETVAEGNYIQRLSGSVPGSGHWSIRIYGPVIE